MWHTVRGDLRNPDLGPLPKACVASMRLCRVELCFNSSFTVVSELDNDADMSAFVRAMVGSHMPVQGGTSHCTVTPCSTSPA